MTVTKSRIYSMAALALGEVPLSSTSQQDDLTNTTFDTAWSQFIPGFIEDTRLRDFVVEYDMPELVDTATYNANPVDVENGKAIESVGDTPEGLPHIYNPRPSPLSFVTNVGYELLQPMEVGFREERLGHEDVRWQWAAVPCRLTGELSDKPVRLICTDCGGTHRVRSLVVPVDPASDDDPWGEYLSITHATEKAIAWSFAEFIAPPRANDEQTMNRVTAMARNYRAKAKQISGQIGSRRFRRTSDLVAVRYGGAGTKRRGRLY